MKSGDDHVRAIASEACLALTDDELKSAVRYINDFIGMADRLKELDLENVEPFCFAESQQCPLREDEENPEPFGGITEILGDRVYFKVPRIMEE